MKTLTFVLAILVALLTTSSASAQNATTEKSSKHQWSNVELLQAGQIIYVKPKTGESFRGVVENVTQHTITIITTKRAITFERGNIRKIHTARKSNITKTLGGALGAVGGFLSSTALIFQSPGDGERDGLNVGIIAGATVGGAYIGRAIGNRWRKNRLVYQAE